MSELFQNMWLDKEKRKLTVHSSCFLGGSDTETLRMLLLVRADSSSTASSLSFTHHFNVFCRKVHEAMHLPFGRLSSLSFQHPEMTKIVRSIISIWRKTPSSDFLWQDLKYGSRQGRLVSNGWGEGSAVSACFSGLVGFALWFHAWSKAMTNSHRGGEVVGTEKHIDLSSQESWKLIVKNIDSVSDLNKHNSVWVKGNKQTPKKSHRKWTEKLPDSSKRPFHLQQCASTHAECNLPLNRLHL